jgi:sugar/nucleoside kinase (ribokinase family)
MIPVLVIGELNVDLIFSGCSKIPAFGTEVTAANFVMTLGSASAICAVGLAKLGRPVSFAGKVGADPWGDFCVEQLRSVGVDVRSVKRESRIQTGVTVALTGDEDRALITYPGATATLCLEEVPDALGSGPGHLHVSSFYLQTGMRRSWPVVFERARQAGWSVSLDPGCDPENAWADLCDLLPLVDVLLPNAVELAGITGLRNPEDALRALSSHRTSVVAKLGAAGSIALDDGRVVRVIPPPVRATDTTGAGDSFNAGFLNAWLDRQPLHACMRAAVACGALSTRALGGTTTQPTGEELADCLEGNW